MIVATAKKFLPLSAVFVIAFLSFTVGATRHPAIVTAQEPSLLSEQELTYSELYRRVSPSVVSIAISDPIHMDLGGGTGFVVSSEGLIITNYHVIEAMEQFFSGEIVVYFLDGTIVRAEVIGRDPDSDLALLQVDVPAERLVPVTFGNSDDVLIGQTALAIGSPFGQRWTLTAGIISAVGRSIIGLSEAQYRIGSVIQTDTPINPGNSGGPLLNLKGEVIGVNAQIISENRANSGVGFAIPSNLVQRVIRELRDQGFVNYAFMGISADDMSLRVIEDLSIPNNTRGVIITSASGPAASGGLRRSDIVLAIDDFAVTDFASLIGYLAINTVPGQTVSIHILRDQQEMDVQVTLTTRPSADN